MPWLAVTGGYDETKRGSCGAGAFEDRRGLVSRKLEKVEELAMLVHGRGAAVSLDPGIVRVWDAKGEMVEEVYGDKVQALSLLFEILERKSEHDEEDP